MNDYVMKELRFDAYSSLCFEGFNDCIIKFESLDKEGLARRNTDRDSFEHECRCSNPVTSTK